MIIIVNKLGMKLLSNEAPQQTANSLLIRLLTIQIDALTSFCPMICHTVGSAR